MDKKNQLNPEFPIGATVRHLATMETGIIVAQIDGKYCNVKYPTYQCDRTPIRFLQVIQKPTAEEMPLIITNAHETVPA